MKTLKHIATGTVLGLSMATVGAYAGNSGNGHNPAMHSGNNTPMTAHQQRRHQKVGTIDEVRKINLKNYDGDTYTAKMRDRNDRITVLMLDTPRAQELQQARNRNAQVMVSGVSGRVNGQPVLIVEEIRVDRDRQLTNRWNSQRHQQRQANRTYSPDADDRYGYKAYEDERYDNDQYDRQLMRQQAQRNDRRFDQRNRQYNQQRSQSNNPQRGYTNWWERDDRTQRQRQTDRYDRNQNQRRFNQQFNRWDQQRQANQQPDQLIDNYQQRDRMQDTGFDQQVKHNVVQGKITSMKDVSLAKVADQHRMVKLESQSGKKIIVDLGAKQQLGELNLKKGDRLMVYGVPARINGKPVLFATRVAELESPLLKIERDGEIFDSQASAR